MKNKIIMKIFRSILSILLCIITTVFVCKFAYTDNILDGIKAVLFAAVYYGNDILDKLNDKDENHTNN
jgi:hypothetical protein